MLSQERDIMANNFMRWMKNKLNGYKQFNPLPDDSSTDYGRMSDTDVLLRPTNYRKRYTEPVGHATDANIAAMRNPINLHPRSHSVEERPTVNCRANLSSREVECDLLMEGETSKADGDKREFSFTLYDLDERGNITKDDIAGLVKSIYETLGQSIKVAQGGGKTIKVQLTVSPQKEAEKKRDEETCASSRSAARCKKTARRMGPAMRKRDAAARKVNRRHSISCASALSADDREADISDEEEDLPSPPIHGRLPNLHSLGTPPTLYSRYEKKSSSMRRQELLEIIRASMEKNNLGFHSRIPLSRPTISVSENAKQRTRHRTAETTEDPPIINDVSDGTPPAPPHRRYPQSPTCHRSYSFSANAAANQQMTNHELKHRFRDIQQARAKEHVIRWLEQEFPSPANANQVQKACEIVLGPPRRLDEKHASYEIDCERKKHRYRHVHQHVHHHYHHYKDLPILV